MSTDLTDALRRKVETMFWQRSQQHLHGPPTDLSALYAECVADVLADDQPPELARLAKLMASGPLTTLDVAIKALGGSDTDGTVDGYLAAYTLDLGNDVIAPGAFSKTLREAKAFAAAHNTDSLYPLLWQHQKDEPIGAITQAREDARGLLVTARLNRDCDRGRQAYDGLKNGYLSFSIGYRPVKYEWKGQVRHLTEIGLAEGSVVTFPMNPEARATA
jgi:HK97 family phage prohead protease